MNNNETGPSLDDEINAITQQLEALQEQKKAQNKYQDHINALQAEISELTEQKSTLGESVGKLFEEVEGLEDEIKHLTTEKQKNLKTLVGQQKNIDKRSDQLQKLEEQIKNVLGSVSTNIEGKVKVESVPELSMNEKEIQALKDKVEILEIAQKEEAQQREALNTELKGLRDENQDLTSNNKALEHDKGNAQKAIGALQEKLRNQDAVVQNTGNGKSENLSDKKTLNKQIAQLLTQKNATLEKANKAEERLQSVERQIQDAEKSLEDILELSEEATNEEKSAQDKILVLANEVQEWEEKLQQVKDEISVTNDELATSKSQAVHTQNALKQVTSEYEDLSIQVQKLKTTKEELTYQVKDLNTQFKNSSEQETSPSSNNGDNTELESLKKQNASLQKRLDLANKNREQSASLYQDIKRRHENFLETHQDNLALSNVLGHLGVEPKKAFGAIAHVYQSPSDGINKKATLDAVIGVIEEISKNTQDDETIDNIKVTQQEKLQMKPVKGGARLTSKGAAGLRIEVDGHHI